MSGQHGQCLTYGQYRELSPFVPVDPEFSDFNWLTTGLFHVIPPSTEGRYQFSEVA